MLENNALVKVTNRDNGIVGYDIPDLGIKRRYSAGEAKMVTAEEMRKLSYLDGGLYIIKHYLIIDNKELVQEILHEVEPEYYYTKKEIKEILLHGSVDEFHDCLDFAPDGVKELIKVLAVDLEIYDTRKMELINQVLGFDVKTAIEFKKEEEREMKEENQENKPSGRRVTVSQNTVQKKSGRRAPITTEK